MRHICILAAILLSTLQVLGQECGISGQVQAPATVYKYSSGNIATLVADPGVVLTDVQWTVNGGTITSIAPNKMKVTFSVANPPGEYVGIYALMSAGPNCTRPARSAGSRVGTMPSSCPTLEQTLTAAANATTRSIAVSATCPWTVANLPSWITLVSPASGSHSGNGTIVLQVQRNPNSTGRKAVFTVNEKEVKVLQQGTSSIHPDYNRDGKTDLLWRSTENGIVYASYMNGASTNGGRWLTGEANNDWNAFPAADMGPSPGDGMHDLFWVRPGATNHYDFKYVNEGYGVTFFTGEANTTLRIAGFSSGGLRIWQSPEGGIRFNQTDSGADVWTESTDWALVAVADLDGNLANDLVYRHVATGEVKGVLFDGAQAIAKEMFFTEPNLQWQIVTSGDVNGDGRADLIWRNSTDGRIWTQLLYGLNWMQGGVVWTEPDPHWVLEGSGDFNGDGRHDLLFRNDLNGIVFVVLLNGSSAIGSGIAHYEPNLNWHLVGPATTTAMRNRDSNSTP